MSHSNTFTHIGRLGKPTYPIRYQCIVDVLVRAKRQASGLPRVQCPPPAGEGVSLEAKKRSFRLNICAKILQIAHLLYYNQGVYTFSRQ